MDFPWMFKCLWFTNKAKTFNLNTFGLGQNMTYLLSSWKQTKPKLSFIISINKENKYRQKIEWHMLTTQKS